MKISDDVWHLNNLHEAIESDKFNYRIERIKPIEPSMKSMLTIEMNADGTIELLFGMEENK